MSWISLTASKYSWIPLNLHCLRPRSSSIPKQSLKRVENVHGLDVNNHHARKTANPPAIIYYQTTVP